jgi:hypothetical protein
LTTSLVNRLLAVPPVYLTPPAGTTSGAAFKCARAVRTSPSRSATVPGVNVRGEHRLAGVGMVGVARSDGEGLTATAQAIRARRMPEWCQMLTEGEAGR